MHLDINIKIIKKSILHCLEDVSVQCHPCCFLCQSIVAATKRKCEERTCVYITRFLLVHEKGFPGTRGAIVFKTF